MLFYNFVDFYSTFKRNRQSKDMRRRQTSTSQGEIPRTDSFLPTLRKPNLTDTFILDFYPPKL